LSAAEEPVVVQASVMATEQVVEEMGKQCVSMS